MQQFTYRREFSVIGLPMVFAANVRMLGSRTWNQVWFAYLWLRHRHDGTQDDWLTREDRYCIQYFADPEISQILDEWGDQFAEGFRAVMLDHVDVDDATPPATYEVCARLERTIAQRIWQEYPKLDDTMLADRRWVWEEAQGRAGELTNRMLWPSSIAFWELIEPDETNEDE